MKVPVVHIITMLELGGAQQNTLYTVSKLDRARYEPILVTGSGGLLLKDAEAIDGVAIYVVKDLVREVRPWKDIPALLRLTRLLRGIRRKFGAGGKKTPVIVHTHSSKAGILGRWAARFAGVPVIVHTVHGFGFNDEQGPLGRGFFIMLEKFTARITGRFVAVARDNVNKGIKEGIFREDDAVVIRSGINTAYFAAPPGDLEGKRTEVGVPVGAPLITMVSCLKPQKAPVDFVRVAARVLREVPDAHFLQVGDGELRGEVESESKRLGLDGHFHLLGWRRDVRDIIHLSDVMVLTSLWEGLARVLPQAMAAGKPVVATAVDGTPEAIRDGINGFLAKPHDVELMARRVVTLLKDRGLAARMGEAGRDLVGEFDESRMLADTEALYERLLDSGRGERQKAGVTQEAV